MPILFPFSRPKVAREQIKGDKSKRADMKETPPQIFEAPSPPQSSRTLRFDWQDWLPYLEDSNASDEQKRELVEALWSIVIGFVDLGWDIKSAPETCGEAFDLAAVLSAAMVSLEDDPKTGEEARDE